MLGFSNKILTGRDKVQKTGFGAGETIPEMTKAEDSAPKGAELDVDAHPSAST